MPEQNSTTEIWKPITGYEGIYEVSNFGRVRSYYTYAHRGVPVVSDKPQRFLNRHLDCNRYRCVVLYTRERRKEFKVHVLVASAFIGPRPKGKEVNHIDGNKSNNRQDNLEYMTRSENVRHAIRTGLWHSHVGEEHPRAKLTDKDVKKIRILRSKFIIIKKRVRMPVAEIANRFHVSIGTIENVLGRKNWTHIS